MTGGKRLVNLLSDIESSLQPNACFAQVFLELELAEFYVLILILALFILGHSVRERLVLALVIIFLVMSVVFIVFKEQGYYRLKRSLLPQPACAGSAVSPPAHRAAGR